MRVRRACAALLLVVLLLAPIVSAHDATLSNVAATEAASRVCALLNNGFLDIYAGTQPATADTALTGQTKLAGLTIAATACASTTNGVATFNAIGSDPSADATGTATWFRAYTANHTTVVLDGSVCVSGCDLNLAATAITLGDTVAVSTLTLTAVKG